MPDEDAIVDVFAGSLSKSSDVSECERSIFFRHFVCGLSIQQFICKPIRGRIHHDENDDMCAGRCLGVCCEFQRAGGGQVGGCHRQYIAGQRIGRGAFSDRAVLHHAKWQRAPLSLINMDEFNGKAVKLRFRSARNADTLYDFQVFLAPGDMWTANVSQNGAGLSFLTTADASCTKPAKSVINATPFQTERLDPSITAAERAGETREGYIEIVTMADIPPSASGLFPLIDLNDGVARCSNLTSNTAWTALDVNKAGLSDYATLGMQPPSSGLTANWTIINVPKALSWSGSALALEAQRDGKAARGNLAYFPQIMTTASAAQNYSADPLYAGANPPLAARMSDFPDISTPYVAGVGTANQQAKALKELLAVTSVSNEFWTDKGIAAETDWLFSMPTKRYAMAVNYKAPAASKLVLNTEVDPDALTMDNFLNSMDGYCVTDLALNAYDRESRAYSVIQVIAAQSNKPMHVCSAVSLLNMSEFIEKLVPLTLLASPPVLANGWMKLHANGANGANGAQGKGRPIIGHAFVRAFNPNVAPGTAGNFSVTWPHRLLKN
ncbi:hypothetical protein G7048_14620 [Diaphorobacter sp. HDW4B]|uniref:hypothetical protein n=1 Tax=Diaphorobacter sp. HDW4B TaxID=2714925 RepID=UPI00140A4C53|nr:hypothetical protein [Diaphorobacter sp. HDW4B]QIL71479.1 hypothetical protein G7048_14620 [Diaphorobacter sp. HDW4B]